MIRPPRLCLRLLLSVLGLAALLSLGLSAPRAPSAEDVRAVSYVLAGGSFADICGEGGHPEHGGNCVDCCLSPVALASGAQRVSTRVVRRPAGGRPRLRPHLHRAGAGDPGRRVRAPPVA